MKILVVTQYFHPEPFKINDLVEQLQKRGHEVCVLTGLPNYPEGKIYSGFGFWKNHKEDYCGARVIRSSIIPRGKGGGLRLLINYMSFAVFASLTVLCRVKGRFDVVFVYEVSPITVAIPALILKRLRRIPVVMWVQDLWPESVIDAGHVRSKYAQSILSALVKRIYKQCDRLLLSSPGFKQSIQSFHVPDRKIGYLPNWAEDFFKPCSRSEPFEHERLLPDGFKVVFAGNVGEAQDFSAIIDAAEKLRQMKDIKWIVLGNGRCGEWARNEVEKRGLSETVHFLGRFATATMPSFYCRSDVMLMVLKKSLIFSLTVPAKLQTYMACARPIVTMLDGEGSEIVKDAGAGLVCNAGDSDKLAENVLAMFHMPRREREKMGVNALEYYKKHFNRETILNELDSVLSAVVAEYH
jgi:glycosyltransferase involved in cell wall biosynthesis